MNKSFKKFWLEQSKKINWKYYPKKTYHKKKGWFYDGKINVYEELIEKNLKKNPNKVAIINIDQKNIVSKFTYRNIDNFVNKFLNFLVKNKITKKDLFIIQASASIETAVCMLALSKHGNHFSVVFEELEEEAIIKRIKLLKPNYFLSNKIINPKILKRHKIKHFKLNFYKKFKPIKNYKKKYFLANSNFFTLFTSGSTGEPKGITHSYGGYLLYSKLTSAVKFGMNEKSIILTASDAGWINGHTYALFGPLSLNSTTIILNKPIQITNLELLKKILKIRLTILYLPVTIVRILKSIYGNKKLLKNSLKVIGSMGEPLAGNVANWYRNFFKKSGKIPLVNTYFQTETGGIILSHSYKDNNLKKNYLGSVGYPLNRFIKFNKISSKKKSLEIATPWPGQMRSVVNGKKYYNNYWKNSKFQMFDYATRKEKQIFIHGRTDDVINIAGHRIGSEEIESVILQIDRIVECCALGVEDELTLEGSMLFVFIVTKIKKANKKMLNDVEEVIENKIITNFGRYAIPKKIYFVDELPKTRSGKILRRLLRNILQNKALSEIDITTLVNKNDAINNIVKLIRYEK